MEELGELIIAIVILVVAFAVKIIEMASRKKMPLPLPLPEIPPEEVFPEEVEIKLEPKVIVMEPPKKIQEKKVEKPAVPISILSRDELEKGIILSTILGPPKSLFGLFRRRG